MVDSDRMRPFLATPINLTAEETWKYYEELGYDSAVADQIWAQEGFQGLERYGEPFGAVVIARLLTDYAGCVIDFGAGLSMYNDPGHFAPVQQTLAPYPNIILLLPSPHLDESVQILKERPRGTIQGQDSNDYLLHHHAYFDLATQVIYTEGKTPEATCTEIMQQVAS